MKLLTECPSVVFAVMMKSSLEFGLRASEQGRVRFDRSNEE